MTSASAPTSRPSRALSRTHARTHARRQPAHPAQRRGPGGRLGGRCGARARRRAPRRAAASSRGSQRSWRSRGTGDDDRLMAVRRQVPDRPDGAVHPRPADRREVAGEHEDPRHAAAMLAAVRASLAVGLGQIRRDRPPPSLDAMNLARHASVLWRFRRVTVAGVVLGIVLAILASYRWPRAASAARRGHVERRLADPRHAARLPRGPRHAARASSSTTRVTARRARRVEENAAPKRSGRVRGPGAPRRARRPLLEVPHERRGPAAACPEHPPAALGPASPFASSQGGLLLPVIQLTTMGPKPDRRRADEPRGLQGAAGLPRGGRRAPTASRRPTASSSSSSYAPEVALLSGPQADDVGGRLHAGDARRRSPSRTCSRRCATAARPRRWRSSIGSPTPISTSGERRREQVGCRAPTRGRAAEAMSTRAAAVLPAPPAGAAPAAHGGRRSRSGSSSR